MPSILSLHSIMSWLILPWMNIHLPRNYPRPHKSPRWSHVRATPFPSCAVRVIQHLWRTISIQIDLF